jgi:hypothetical protein
VPEAREEYFASCDSALWSLLRGETAVIGFAPSILALAMQFNNASPHHHRRTSTRAISKIGDDYRANVSTSLTCLQ